jgi:hypothetical protein
VEKLVPQEPMFARAIRGPIDGRTQCVEALTCTPSMPDETLTPPEPRFMRATRGPSPSRTLRVEVLMRTPGMIRTLYPMGMSSSFSSGRARGEFYGTVLLRARSVFWRPKAGYRGTGASENGSTSRRSRFRRNSCATCLLPCGLLRPSAAILNGVGKAWRSTADSSQIHRVMLEFGR